MLLTGAEIVVECLKEQGVDTVFGFPGGAVLYCQGHAADQTAAAHRHHHVIHFRQLLQDFRPGRALTGDDRVVVEGMDQRITVALA